MRKGWSVFAAIALVVSFSMVTTVQALPETVDRVTAVERSVEPALLEGLWNWVKSLFGAADARPAEDAPGVAEEPGTQDRGEVGSKIDPSGASDR
ncbi:MAG: hypothetical protein AAF481_00025 [Acidobacteriota bacterium]